MGWRRSLMLLGAILLLAGFALWRALQPPPTLALPERGVVLAGVTVVNPGVAHTPARLLRVSEGRIESIEAGAVAPGPENPYAGAFVLPGLIDMHVHFPPDTGLRQSELFAFLFLAHGVTSVRDAGDVDGTATAPARTGVRGGRFPGPRIFACGPFLDGSEPLWKNSLVVNTPAEAVAAVEKVALDGFDCVKVYDRLTAEVLAAIRSAAARHGLRVIGHVPRKVPFELARLDDVQHLTGVQTPAFGDERPFPKNMVEWAKVDDARMDFIVRASRQLGIAHTPTLVVIDRLLRVEDYASLREEADAKLLPRLYRDVVWSPAHGLPILRRLAQEDFAVLADVSQRSRRLVKRLHDGGAAIHAGTDTQNPFVVPGTSLHRELRLLVEAGLTPEQALAAATHVPGAFLGVPGLGRIEPGAPADLLILRDDPTQDLDALASLEAVVADGRLYTREQLDAQLARYRAHMDGSLFDALSVVLAKRALARIVD